MRIHDTSLGGLVLAGVRALSGSYSRIGKDASRARTRLGVLFTVALLLVSAIDAGTFAPKVDFPTNLGPTGVAVVDLDGDGKSDIAVANYGSVSVIGHTVSVLRNTTSGGGISFAPKVDFVTANGPHGLAVSDVDGDARPDLITSDYSDHGTGIAVSILRNTSTPGNISFASKVDVGTGSGPVGLAAADLNGDGKPDLVVANFGDGSGTTVSVLRNASTPGSVSFDPKVDFVTGAGPYGVAVGDVDGDGKPDLAIANFGAATSGDGSTVSVLRNTSTSGVISFAAKVDFTTGAGPRGAILADLDADGRLDIAVTNFGVGGSGNTVSILRNTSTSGNVSFAPKSDLAAGTGPLGIESRDLDGDGKPDLAVTNYGTSWPLALNLGANVSVFGNTSASGTISFAPRVNYGTQLGPHAVAVGDVNQDNKPELAVVNYDNGDGNVVSILQNTTGGLFNTPTPTPTGLNAPTATTTPLLPTPTNTSGPLPATNTPTATPAVVSTTTSTPIQTTDLLFDDFPGTSLSSAWYVPWNAAPTIAGSTATFSGGNTIESTAAFGDLTVFEVRAQYSLNAYTGLCWTNSGVSNYVCWVPLSTNTSHFALFTSDGGETDTGLTVPPGYHRYAIARGGTAFTVYLDGTAVYSASDGAVNVNRTYLSGYGGFAVDWACVYAAGSACQAAGLPVSTATPTSTPLQLNTPTNTPVSIPTDTPTAAPTNTSAPPTATNVPVDTPTNTLIPPTATNSPANTATSTPVPPITTGFLGPSAQGPQTANAGDNNGYELNRANAFANDGLLATDANSGTNTSTSCTNNGKDKHLFYNFNLSIPSSGVIQGIQVRLDARADRTSNTPSICVQISSDGGSTWTAAKQTPTLGTTEATYILGTPSDTWGRNWSAANFGNSNFRIRIIDVAGSTARDFYLDYVAVSITYQP